MEADGGKETPQNHCHSVEKGEALASRHSADVGRSPGLFTRQESTKLRKSSDQSPPDKEGELFWAMWYKALIAFMLNKGGLRSAAEINGLNKNQE
jgi:hypothetical protein